MSEQIYNKKFYEDLASGAERSAQIYLRHLFQYWVPRSVIDIGCGTGTWLSVCAEHAVSRLVGVDGTWNSQEKMVNPRIEFHAVDLNAVFSTNESFDLAMSLEVAEHIRPECSENIVDSLTGAAGAILFGAAFAGQPGDGHINTRPHSFWFEHFVKRGYVMFDLFRPVFWNNELVEPWYRQNTFLYVKREHALFHLLSERGLQFTSEPTFVDCVHPWLYLMALAHISEMQKSRSGESGVPAPNIAN